MEQTIDCTKLQVCDIILSYDKKSIVSELIWKVSRLREDYKDPKISHSMIYIGDELISEGDYYGIGVANIAKYTFSRFDLYKGTVNVPFDKEAVLHYMRETVGVVRYGYVQVFVNLINKVFRVKINKDPKGMTCSEYLCKAFLAAGVVLVREDCTKITPLDMFNSKLISFVKLT